MRDSLRLFAVVGLLTISASPVRAAENNALSALTAVTVKSTPDEVVVVIAGSKAPDFTSFTRSDPFRVVVDWAGSRLSGVSEESRFEHGLIRSVTTRQFDSEAEKISRVTLELGRETSYHVEADGKQVVVRFKRSPDLIPDEAPAPDPALAAAQPAAAATTAPEDATPPLTEPVVQVPPAVPAVSPAPAAPAQEARGTTKETPAAAPMATAPGTPAAGALLAGAPLAGAPLAGAPANDPRAAEKVHLASLNAPSGAKAATPPPAEVTPARPKVQHLAALGRVSPVEAPRPEATLPRVTAPAAAPPSLVAALPTQRLAAGAPSPDGDSYPSRWTIPSLPVPGARAKLASFAVAQKEPVKPVTPSADAPKAEEDAAPAHTPAKADGAAADPNDFDPGQRVMKYIGFQQMADGSRVFVRCDGKVKFKQATQGSNVVLELVNTKINVKNNQRPLDTTYFNSAVTKVQAVPTSEGTRVEIKLREPVPYQVKRIGNTLAIDFKRAAN